MIELSREQVLAYRLARHGLDRRSRLAAPEVSRRINGIHAQVMSAAELSAGARTCAESPGSMRAQLWETRKLVKTWAMRGTLHLLAAEDLGLYMAAQRRRTASWERRWTAYFGLPSTETMTELVDAVGTALDGRILTRAELAKEISRRLRWMDESKMLSGWGTFLGLPARHGTLCFGPSQGANVRFVRPDQWLGSSYREVDPAHAERELLRRYLHVNGPAVRRDFQIWLGQPPALPAWNAVLPETVEVSVEGDRGWLLAADLEAVQSARFDEEVRLLPFFDHYMLTHHTSRRHLVADEHKAKIYRTAGWVTPVVLVRGRVAGTWGLEKGVVTVSALRPLAPRERKGLAREAKLLGEFLGASVKLG
jgi:hypothetical protein